ncbi:GMC oxidoreductase [Hypoxylon trugodes]|uniref:GMC oxidoreductase n=1 Tax=Hypoxylon trugodes TaxID=326681 RepID=UPI0021929026|nr:GMC oxidoreductase [Hypoxylon trugodes]KAI1385460.1 GMC oxidoreductase [Hypoxylon trugodes]
MGLYKKLATGLEEVDIIIAGGGTSGCIVAGRLAESNPDLSILVIESGPDNYDNPKCIYPGLYLQNLRLGSDTTILYKANKSEKLAGRECLVPSGGTLGGASSINLMMYTRAQRDDYDSWETPGWTTDKVWPYLKKLETYHGQGKPEYHGYNGPMQVTNGRFRSKRVEDEWLRAAGELGYPEIVDLQDLESNNGFSRWLRYITPEGKRSDTAHAYLHPLLRDGKHPNLHVLVESNVVRVTFDRNKQANGVEFTPNPRFQVLTGFTPPQPKQIIRARKLVVVSCGACGTPAVLERSGIGSKEVLDRAGVPLFHELPGVGHHYQDHNLMGYTYRTSLEPNETGDAIASGRLSAEDAIAKNHPHLGWNIMDLSSKLRLTEAEVDAMGPEFRAVWDRDFKDKPNRPFMLMAVSSGVLGDQTGFPPGQYVSVAPYTAYPYSRGHMHITGPDTTDPLDFDMGFFTDENDIDIKMQIWAYKKGRDILRRTGIYRGEYTLRHPQFPEGSAAVCSDEWHQSAEGYKVQDIEYTPEDDAAIEQYLRENVQTTWHSIGTAKMAPQDEMGVVDKDLNVYGVKGLKVVDMSIAPKNVAANTSNTAMMIGEKAADIIAKELGLAIKE